MDDGSAAAERAYWEGEDGAGIALLEDLVQGIDVVGVVGFSMGAKVGMELVRRLAMKERAGGGVKVFVAVCGTVPFQGGGLLLSGDNNSVEEEAKEKGYRESLAKGLVKVEAVHLIGDADPWRPESEKLVGFFEEEKRTVIRFKGEHQMPLDVAINKQVVSIIMAACAGGV